MVKNRQGRLCLCGLQKYAAFHKGSLTGGIAVVLAVMMLGSHLARAVVHASIVVDAHSGTVIEAYNSEVPVHPASLAKLMTLYITFQELKDGKLSLNEELPVSAHAASQEPTKLWLRPGSKVSVRSCILGITTRSANDAAVVLAEAIGGSESSFAQRMTATAHWLGMTHTTFRNATGLPDPPDWTTAHDMARLAIALINGFPQYYHFFSARSFQFRGRTIYTLDNLLYEYRGAVEHPRPVHALVDLLRQGFDLAILKPGPGGQDSAQQDRGVDGRKLRPGPAPAGLNVREVIEEAVHLRHLMQVPVQRRSHALHHLGVRQIAVLVGDAQRRQPEAGRCDAGHPARIAAAGKVVARPIQNLPGARTALFPEEQAALPHQLVKKLFVSAIQLPGRGGDCQAFRQHNRSGQRRQPTKHLPAAHSQGLAMVFHHP